MHDLYSKFSRNINLLVVYITEAHAVDEWPVGDPLKIMQPKSTIERISIVRKFKNDYDFLLPILVDTIDNEYEKTYSAWPIRFYVFHKNKIVFRSSPDEMNTYDSIPPNLESFLRNY